MRLAVAMSGGVDSSLAACSLLEQGHALQGYFMDLPVPRAEERWQRAADVARRLGIPLVRLDLRRVFHDRVIVSFLAAWHLGRTPNPCVVCNSTIKFGALLEAVLADGLDAMATGHYARLARESGGVLRVRQSMDKNKDQSYFLCRVPAESLARLCFPLGDMRKEEVRARACALGLPVGPESQDVCFLEDSTPADYLAASGNVPEPGIFVTGDGRELGQHLGIHRYTIGQRRGLGLPDATPWYVLRIEVAKNQIVLGKADDLLARCFLVHELDWRGPELPWRGRVRLRSRQRECDAVLHPETASGWLVECLVPQRAVTPGQYAVFYDGDRVMGSGEIDVSVAEAAGGSCCRPAAS